MTLYGRLRLEFWWWCERKAGKLWNRFCPADAASYWMDPLPAWCYVRRKEAEKWFFRRGVTIYGKPWTHGNPYWERRNG